jgi:hypothetical protein
VFITIEIIIISIFILFFALHKQAVPLTPLGYIILVLTPSIMMSAKQHSRKQHIEPAIYAGGEYANHCIIEMFSVIFMTRTILYLNKSVVWIKKNNKKEVAMRWATRMAVLKIMSGSLGLWMEVWIYVWAYD